MANKMIVVTKRPDDVHARLADYHGVWGCGKTENEAIGDLVRSNQNLFQLEISKKEMN